MLKGSLQIKNGIYQAVFYTTDQLGKQKTIWKSTGISAVRGNKRRAEQRLSEIREELEAAPLTEDVLFADFAMQWLECEKDKVDPVTFQGYKQYVLKHIIPYFKPKKLSLREIDVNFIEGYYKHESAKGRLDGKGGLSKNSLRRQSVVLNLMFREAIKNRLINANPCTYADIPKQMGDPAKSVSFYSAEQCAKLLELIEGTPLHDMVYITFIYGLRRSELMGLKWCDVDFKSNTLTIQHTRVANGDLVVEKDSTKTKSSNRTYPLLPEVKDILESIRKSQTDNRKLFGNCYIDSDYVFVREDGKLYHPSYPTHTLRKVIEKNKMPVIRWHDLRHSCASMLILKGWQMKDISDWLGHSGIGITMNLYTHLDISHKREMSKSIEGILDL